MADELSTGAEGARGASDWVAPKRPSRLRVFVKRRRAQILRIRSPRPADPPSVPDGWATGPPDFVGVGAQRAGTSRWFHLICAHPHVRLHPEAAKEIHFFDRLPLDSPTLAEPAPAYARHFPRPPGALTGEWTPCYMASFWAIPALRRAAPDARLLVSLRDPIDRFASGLARMGRSRREGGLPVRPEDVSDAATRCLYGSQLDRLLAEFPREQVLILQYERCCLEPEQQLARTWDFLGLSPAPLPGGVVASRVNNAGPPPEVSQEVVSSLVRLLAEDVEQLADLVPDLDLSLWRSWSKASAAPDLAATG